MGSEVSLSLESWHCEDTTPVGIFMCAHSREEKNQKPQLTNKWIRSIHVGVFPDFSYLYFCTIHISNSQYRTSFFLGWILRMKRSQTRMTRGQGKDHAWEATLIYKIKSQREGMKRKKSSKVLACCEFEDSDSRCLRQQSENKRAEEWRKVSKSRYQNGVTCVKGPVSAYQDLIPNLIVYHKSPRNITLTSQHGISHLALGNLLTAPFHST